MSAGKQIIKEHHSIYICIEASFIPEEYQENTCVETGKCWCLTEKGLRPNPSCWDGSANRHTAPKVNNI